MTNGWHIGKFRDVLEPVSRPVQVEADKVYKNLGVQWYAYGLFVREEKPGHEIQAKELYRVEFGDLVYNRLFAWKGSFAIADKDTAGGYVSGEFPCFRVDTNRAEAKYLHLYLSQKKIWEEIERTSTGQTSISRLRLKESVFLDMDIPLPPLDEQRRIVERVGAIATRIAKAQSLREEASQEVDYLYGREVAELFTNARDWQTYILGELTTDISYGTSEKAHSERIGIPVFRMGNIQSGKLDLSDMKYMHPSQQELQKLTLQKGDILVNRTNSAELVGKCAVFDLDGDYLFASYIIRLRIDSQKANPYLVAEYINSPLGRAYMFAERKQMTGQANVNSQKLRALPIKLPSLDEQRRIVAYLDSVQARLVLLRELQSATGEELSALLPSVLDRAFKGEL